MNTRRLVLFLLLYLAILSVTASISYFVGNKTLGLKPNITRFSGDTVMVGVPRARMDLAKMNGSTNSVRMKIILEINNKDIERLDGYLPRIMDRIQSHMLNVTPDEIKNSKDLQWLRDDLAWEANLVSGPVRIQSIRFNELVVD